MPETPPNSNNAERACLGCILLRQDTFAVIDSIIDESDFWNKGHQIIYNAMRFLINDGTAVDNVTLGELLIQRGEIEKAGGILYLGELTDGVATTVNAEAYANVVRERSAARAIMYAAGKLVDASRKGMDATLAAMEAVTEASDMLSRSRMPASLLDLGDEVMANYNRAKAGFSGIALPWPTLNEMTMGMWPGTTTFFVARPGVGKTFVAVIAARHAWLEGHPTLIVSPEMSKEEIAERFFVVDSGVNYDNVVRGTLGAWELPKLVDSINSRKGGTGLYIMDADDDLSPKGIESAIRACKPELVGIDSIYDLRIRGERRDRALVALEWMRRSSKRFGVPFCAFAQQNRAAELSEKKGGGSRLGTIALADEIGQDAHSVFALEQDKDMRADKKLSFKPLKLRRGRWSGDDVIVNWDFEKMNFSEDPVNAKGKDFDDQDDIPF